MDEMPRDGRAFSEDDRCVRGIETYRMDTTTRVTVVRVPRVAPDLHCANDVRRQPDFLGGRRGREIVGRTGGSTLSNPSKSGNGASFLSVPWNALRCSWYW